MLAGLIRVCARRRGVVIGVAVALVIAGLRTVAGAKLDVFPEFAPPQVSIQTEAAGLAAEQVELLVTKPLEDAINGVEGITALRSQSIQGLSVITAVLGEGTEIHRARQAVGERLVEAGARLPLGVRPPVLSPLTSSSSTVLVVGITSGALTPAALRTLADRLVKPALLATPGVAKVAIFGGEVRQLQIQAQPDRMRRAGITLAELQAVAERATGVRGAGVLDGPNQRVVVRSEGQRADAESLGETAIRASPGSVLRLRDVALVTEGAEPRIGEGGVDGTRGLVIVVSAQLGGNTKVVAEAVEATLARIAPAITAGRAQLHPPLFRPAAFVDLALRNLTTSLLLGAVLVAVVLVLFLADAAAAAISLTAIPLSLLAAVLVLDALGYSLNTLTLGGLAIALGEVVDDAIIDVENIARRLRERAATDLRSALEVVVDASLEVRSSVVYATFVVAIVFVPVVTLSGVQGALFRPLALAYILATMASLLVALFVTPALTLLLLGRRGRAVHEPQLLRALARRYERLLAMLLLRPRRVAAGAVVLCLGAGALLPLFGATFLPEFREGHFVIHMSAVPGTSLEESFRLGQRVTEELKQDARVRAVAQRIGRAELSEDTWGTHYTELEVDLQPLEGADAITVQDDLRDRLAAFPGAGFAIRGFLSERIEETLTGATAEVVVRVIGDDLDSLDVAARRVAQHLRAIGGAADVQYEPPPVTPELRVRVREREARRLGLRNDEVLAAVETATRGTVVGQVYDLNRPVDVVLLLAPEARRTSEALGRLPLRVPDGRLLQLREVVEFAQTSGRSVITHAGTRRVQLITANVRGRDVSSFTTEAEQVLRRADARLPIGVLADVGGSGVAAREARAELFYQAGFAGLGILLLLAMAFGSARPVLLVAANMPFALVGGVLAVAATGATLSLGSLVGFVTLFGIATRNAVMLIAHYEHLVTHEGAEWGTATLLRGARERLGPILMTALVTGLGLLPLALGSGEPGREIEGPMAIVILGGLASSTVLSLFVLPVLAQLSGRAGPRAH